MAIKSVVFSNDKSWNYPCLGKSLAFGTIVLFTGRSEGIVIAVGNSPSGDLEVGTSDDSWDMQAFEVFSGNVTLTQ